jgi:threonine dehydrogenase-like Zn-dependent dehydrogenase
MARVLTLRGPRDLAFEEVDHERALGEREVRLRAVLSGISQGTEMNLYRGTSPFDGSVFDPELRSFIPDERRTGTYPLALGYELVAEVVEVGDGVGGVELGDLVHTGCPHQDWAIAQLDELLEFGYPLAVLPDGADPRPGIFVSLGSVALQAVHDARIKVGDAVAVSGLGTIGLLVVQLAARSGADPIVAVDPIPERRRLVESLGATVAIDPLATPTVGAAVKKANGNTGVDVAIETSGAAAGLHGAIAAVAVGGRVVSVGFYQGDALGLRLGEEWHHNRPTMVSSMGVWGCPHRDYPAWDRQRLTDTVVGLLYGGGIETGPLISEIAAFDDALDVYRAIDGGSREVRTVGLAYPESEHLITTKLDRAAGRAPAGATTRGEQ